MIPRRRCTTAGRWTIRRLSLPLATGDDCTMGRITTGIGLISGINRSQIIDQLMELEARPKSQLQQRIDTTNQRRLAYADLVTRLTSLRLTATTLRKTSTFSRAATSSSNENVLTATASTGASAGSYRFQVARLVTTQQSISNGFADPHATAVGAGTLTIEMGGGELTSQVTLDQLNGGSGVRRGIFRITDRSGQSALIDISAAVTLQDVVRRINTSLGVSVRAQVAGDRITLTDLTGQTAGNLIVQDVGDGYAAADLGIVANVADNTLTGTNINYLGRATSLNQLNDGLGVRTAASGADLRITASDGRTFDVTVRGLSTIGQVLDAINTATGGDVTAEVAADGKSLKLTDTTGGGGTFAVTPLNSSRAAADLGIEAAGAGGVIAGRSLLAKLGTVLLSSLRGGSGVPSGSIEITDRAGGSATIDLSSATTVQDVLDLINAAPAVAVTASLKPSGNGILLTDTSGGTGSLSVADSATAQALGLVGTSSAATLAGENVQRQWIGHNTALAGLNGGKGISPGRFRIIDSGGRSATIDLTAGTQQTLGEVIRLINASGVRVTASINANGDGMLLTDTAGGAGSLAVEDLEGTAARDLNIRGTATGTTIDGAFEKTLTIEATDTLEDVQKKINQLSFGVSATIVNDGSPLSPYRLSLTARQGGRAGRVVLDAGQTSLGLRTLVESQDAAVFMGGASEQPLLITSSRNQLADVIRGVTIDLHSVSESPVTLSVTPSADNVVSELEKFTENFNAMIDKLRELTRYDSQTQTRGLLLGDATAQEIENQAYAMLQSVVQGAGRYRVLADVGLRVGKDSKLEFDADKFRSAWATDSTAVQRLFTATVGATSETKLSATNSSRGVRDGRIRITDSAGASAIVQVRGNMTVGSLLSAVNAAGIGVTASLADGGTGVVLTDTAGGGAKLTVTDIDGNAAADLGIRKTATGTTITGTFGLLAQGAAGIIESRITRLIDPVSGLITRENKTLDQRVQQFQDRIEQLDKVLAAKRARLEKQFASLETVLANLQNQQSSLASLSQIAANFSK